MRWERREMDRERARERPREREGDLKACKQRKRNTETK